MNRIKVNKSGKVRVELFYEDVDFAGMENVMEEFGLLDKFDTHVVLKEPIRVPKFNKFYASRIKSAQDEYIFELFDRLLYLNPSPDKFLKMKIVEYIVLNFSAMRVVESSVKIDKCVVKPVLTFEAVHGALVGYMKSGGYVEYVPDNEVRVLFYRDSTLSKDEKISIKAFVRAHVVQEYLSNAIHVVAEHLIDENELIKVTHSRIENTKMIRTQKGEASVRTIRKYMSDRTKRIMEEHNLWAKFKTVGAYQKFTEFLEMGRDREGLSQQEIAKILGVSKSTVNEYYKLI